MSARPRSIEFIREMSDLSSLVAPDISVSPPRVMASVLSQAYPEKMSARTLMEVMGLNWQEQPISSFVSLCVVFKNINQGLRAYGWQAVRSDGTPDASYSLKPRGA